jgi:DNA replication protein DnaC
MTASYCFGIWAELMNEEGAAAAMLARLLHHAHIFSLKKDTNKMKDRLQAGMVDFE